VLVAGIRAPNSSTSRVASHHGALGITLGPGYWSTEFDRTTA
jgi:hypothetical protein